jgi:hypothetical protein
MRHIALIRLDPMWNPWTVPRVRRRSVTTAAAGSLVERWLKRRQPTAFQRCLAIHILNATYKKDVKDIAA